MTVFLIYLAAVLGMCVGVYLGRLFYTDPLVQEAAMNAAWWRHLEHDKLTNEDKAAAFGALLHDLETAGGGQRVYLHIDRPLSHLQVVKKGQGD